MQGFIGIGAGAGHCNSPCRTDWQPVQLSPNGCGMSPAWEADDEPSRVILEDLKTVKIASTRPIQERVAAVYARGHQSIHNTFLR